MYPVPINDAERVSALRSLHLLDREGHASFDAIVDLLADTLGAAMAMISLIDDRRQWFLASRGLTVAQTSRDIAFCNYPVAGGEPLLVRDARDDPRFADNPAVSGQPGIRSYIGCPLRAANGFVVGTLCAADPVPDRFTPAQLPVLQSMARVVEHLFTAQASQQALHRAARIDELTGLLNRNAFVAALNGMIPSRTAHADGPVLLLFDLDGFRHVNDTHGHAHGDLALEEIGERLQRLVPHGQAGRWGSDVFAIALPAASLSPGALPASGLIPMAEDVLRRIGAPIRLGETILRLTAGCGIARHEPGLGAKDLLRRAELAIHHGKRHRLPGVHVYDPLLEDQERARLAAETEVYAALDSDRIFAAYQPIVDLRSRAIRGYEALLRISRPDGQVMTAGQLLPALVNPDVSRKVATRMSRLVASEFASLAAITPGSCHVGLNATEADLLGEDFVPMLFATLDRYGMPPERVTLEITETMLVNDLDRVKAVLAALKARGLSIALDDFGTGFSSLTHLKVFPIDKVKIDRSFVKDITHDHHARSIVAAVIAMARSLSIEVIAEGIEEEAQLAMLVAMGCDLGQGYLLSPPRNIAYHHLSWRANMNRTHGDRASQAG